MTEPAAVLLFARDLPAAGRVRDILAEAGLRVLRSHDPGDAVAQLMDDPVQLLLLDGGALTPLAERVFRRWQRHDPLLETVGLAGGAGSGPALLRMNCRSIVRPPMDAAALVGAIRVALDARARKAAQVRGGEEVAGLVLQATRALTGAVERKDLYARGRPDRVALFAGILADEVGGLDVDRVRTAARVMDVGMAAVPESVLTRTGRLSDEEFEQVKRHPVVSWELLRHLFSDELVLRVARHHHERWDGAGYPDGLAGDAIPLEARVLAVADSLDAITSTRAYRQARLWSDAVYEIVAWSGRRYDPDVVDAFQRASDRLLAGA